MNSHNNTTHIQPTPVEQLEAFLQIDNLEELPLSIDNTLLFKHLFQFIGVNGKGSFGVVIKVIDKKNLDNAAIKVYIYLRSYLKTILTLLRKPIKY